MTKLGTWSLHFMNYFSSKATLTQKRDAIILSIILTYRILHICIIYN